VSAHHFFCAQQATDQQSSQARAEAPTMPSFPHCWSRLGGGFGEPDEDEEASQSSSFFVLEQAFDADVHLPSRQAAASHSPLPSSHEQHDGSQSDAFVHASPAEAVPSRRSGRAGHAPFTCSVPVATEDDDDDSFVDSAPASAPAADPPPPSSECDAPEHPTTKATATNDILEADDMMRPSSMS